jgi:hypothetical protein
MIQDVLGIICPMQFNFVSVTEKKHASDLLLVPLPPGPKGELEKCEFCGKVDLRSKFKKSKRFCSMSCAKR